MGSLLQEKLIIEMVAGPGEDLREMIARLEQQELDCQTASGSVPAPLYTELLAAYLADGELIRAKFLWKRIPAATKQDGELPRVWAIGKAIWGKESSAVYTGLKGEWSPEVGAVVTRIGEKYREAALALVAKAYSTIRIADLAVYLGQTEAEAGAQVATLGWTQESGVVTPKNEKGKNATVPPTEDQLNRLTDFIAFLEN